MIEPSPRGGPDVEPLYTFRGHSGPVLCCSCANSANEILLFSGSADSTVRYWRLPAGTDINIYDPYGKFFLLGFIFLLGFTFLLGFILSIFGFKFTLIKQF